MIIDEIRDEQKQILREFRSSNKRIRMIVGPHHVGKSYLLNQVFNESTSDVRIFQCGGPPGTEQIVNQSLYNDLVQITSIASPKSNITVILDEIVYPDIINRILELSPQNIIFFLSAFENTLATNLDEEVFAIDLVERFKNRIKGCIVRSSDWLPVSNLTVGDWFELYELHKNGCDLDDSIRSASIQHNRSVKEKQAAKTKTVISSSYYNCIKVYDFSDSIFGEV